MGDPLILRAAVAADAASIATIYAHYVRDTAVTFEIDPPGIEEMSRRIKAVSACYPYIVAEDRGTTVGYAYATELYARAAYRWVAETTIYMAPDSRGLGIGRKLYMALIAELRARGFYAAIGKITLPNDASTSLHERLGFALTGRLNAVGHKHGRWHDVGLYQLELAERQGLPAEPAFGDVQL